MARRGEARQVMYSLNHRPSASWRLTSTSRRHNTPFLASIACSLNRCSRFFYVLGLMHSLPSRETTLRGRGE